MLSAMSAQPEIVPVQTEPAPQSDSPGYLGWVIFVLFWVQALNIVDRHVFGLAIPGIKEEFGLSDQFLGALAGLAFAIFYSVAGIRHMMTKLGMLKTTGARRPPWETIVCGKSYWMYTDRGGVLEVFPHLVDSVAAGERVAQVRNVYGEVIRDYYAPEAGVVIGRSTNPVNQTGSRILHLGVMGDPEKAPTAPDE